MEPEGYSVELWDRNDRECKNAIAKTVLSNMKGFDGYTAVGRGFIKNFAFPAQEEELIDHIKLFKKSLTKVIATNQSKPA